MKLRLGKKQKRAVLDLNGNEIVVFPKRKEWYAEKFVELFNKECSTELGLFEEIVEKCPWYIKLWVEFQFKLIDIKHYFIKKMKNIWKIIKKNFVEKEHSASIILEKKIINQNNKLIDQIHYEFYTEVDKLLEFARILKPLNTNKQDLIDKAKRLKKLGFVSSKDLKEADIEAERLQNIQKENFKKQELKDAIDYFSNKYPLYKFITEDSVKKICEKYNLIYGEVNKYKGDVPDKNLKEIENFKVDKEDLVYKYYEHHSTFYIKKDSYTNFMMYVESRNYESSSLNYLFENLNKVTHSLEIVTPLKDFDTSGMEIKDFKLSKIEIPDPIVLQPVLYNHTKHYLIVTAWGQEVTDPLVLNPKFN